MTAAAVIGAAALFVALVALAQARRTARQLAQITELYWQLKFDHGELKSKVAPPAPPAAPVKQTFVPLTSLRPDAARPLPGDGGTGSTRE